MEVVKNKDTNTAHQKLKEDNEALREKISYLEETLNSLQLGTIGETIVKRPERKQIDTQKEENNFYKQLIESIQDGVALITFDLQVIYCNRRLTEIFSVTGEKIVGNSISKFFDHIDISVFRSTISNGKNETFKREVKILTGDGRKIPVLVSCNIVRKTSPKERT